MFAFSPHSARPWPGVSILALLAVLAGGCAQQPQPASQPAPVAAVTVDGKVALAALMALTESHLQKLSDDLQGLAAGGTGRWPQTRERLAAVAGRNVAAAYWFAWPDGSYATLDAGRAEGNLADRPYWPKLMAGQAVMGDLVVSKSTGKNVAVVAVPVRRRDGGVAGAFGASVYLDRLSEQLKQEMGLDGGAVFYAVDGTPKGALHHDSQLIFTEPKKLGAELGPAFDDMLSREEGVETYSFHGQARTVLFRKSAKIGWWFAFGRLGEDSR
ncbi:hypothetical protein [Methylogaea oryzae]|uniref:Cache domain-containing protein n=2 Tax=Methylogaea oryzae TaxID=1295382 RepID=A0A8D4VQB2_9GAMM|nr:hypothetical protein [Methylogaea oryzae]BBL72095.1 hypothetical protein MoryE10_27010 [Methylogaea oryzae]